MRSTLMAAALAAVACSAPAVASADSHAYNAYGNSVDVFWIAAGCAGVESSCSNSIAIGFVCKKKRLEPEQSGSYHFKDGTSARKLVVDDCSSGWSTSHGTGNKGSKKRCAAISAVTNGETHASASCGYTDSEYEALKNGTNASLRKGPTTTKLPGYPKR